MSETFIAGKHVIIDFYTSLTCRPDIVRDMDWAMEKLRRCIIAAEGNIVHQHSHQFPGEGSGYTGFFLLAESHVSIHTWPEKDYAAIDIFGCNSKFVDSFTWHITMLGTANIRANIPRGLYDARDRYIGWQPTDS